MNLQPIIRLEHIFAAYERKTVLEDVSLNVYERDFLGIIGPNGGGKTTLVKLILGLLRPVSGAVRFYQEGEEVIACLLFQALADKVDHGCLLFLHRALGDAEEGGDFGVLQTLLEVELENAAVPLRELVDGIVEEVEALIILIS